LYYTRFTSSRHRGWVVGFTMPVVPMVTASDGDEGRHRRASDMVDRGHARYDRRPADVSNAASKDNGAEAEQQGSWTSS
jgi:hypothetical protein